MLHKVLYVFFLYYSYLLRPYPGSFHPTLLPASKVYVKKEHVLDFQVGKMTSGRNIVSIVYNCSSFTYVVVFLYTYNYILASHSMYYVYIACSVCINIVCKLERCLDHLESREV